MRLERAWLEELVFSGEAPRRFTQDSPILPDVWLAYGTQADPDDPVDLLLTPFRNTTPGALALDLHALLPERRASRRAPREAATSLDALDRRHRSIASNQSVVAARLQLDEALHVAVTLSPWWRSNARAPGVEAPFTLATLRQARFKARVIAELEGLAWRQVHRGLLLQPLAAERPRRTRSDGGAPGIAASFLWFVRVVGSLLLASREPAAAPPARTRRSEPVSDLDRFRRIAWSFADQYDAFVGVMRGVDLSERKAGPSLFLMSRNRAAEPSVDRSVPSVKADAAIRLFKITCDRLTWAVVDSGVDATHPAFRKRDAAGKPLVPGPKQPAAGLSRVTRTFDFTRVRYLLNPSMVEARERRDAIRADLKGPLGAAEKQRHRRELQFLDMVLSKSEAAEHAKSLRSMLLDGRMIDWDLLQPYLQVPHDADYEPPGHDHGTHVAGILAGDWRVGDENTKGIAGPGDVSLVGMCPDISLYDLRVFSGAEGGDEFAVLAAMQFLRWLNARGEQPVMHGANLSLSIQHDVTNFACGRTPICDECERVVASGVVVVAAAGNEGRAQFTLASGDSSEGYRSISISDPGNAEKVITVGATHRHQPHTYGVSYFSSRGPTGDGRSKPDLVAPGEKITAPVPGGASTTKDGTSMAAPHVSGAAALLMARHRELMGNPQRVKDILCETATDLGRERYFQGRGLVDVLRAIQSV